MQKNEKAARDTAMPRAANAESRPAVPVSIIPQNGGAAQSVFIRVPEAMTLMGCSRSTAQRCFVEINRRLREKGQFTIAGRCNRREFYRAIGFFEEGDSV